METKEDGSLERGAKPLSASCKFAEGERPGRNFGSFQQQKVEHSPLRSLNFDSERITVWAEVCRAKLMTGKMSLV
jgi:hypothetical protein